MSARVPASLSRRFGAVAASLARRDGAALPLRLTCPHARELGHLSRNFGRLPGGSGRAFLEDVAQRAAALLPQRAPELHSLVPALLHSDKAPKGFENFFKKGENGAKETPGSEAKETPAAKPTVEKTGGGGDGGGDNKGDNEDKKKKDDGEGPKWNENLPQILATLVVSAVLLTMMGGRYFPLCPDNLNPLPCPCSTRSQTRPRSQKHPNAGS